MWRKDKVGGSGKLDFDVGEIRLFDALIGRRSPVRLRHRVRSMTVVVNNNMIFVGRVDGGMKRWAGIHLLGRGRLCPF
jgi:hypothetical protein